MPAKCDFCGIELDPKDKLKHQWDQHREEMLKISAKRKPKGNQQPPVKQKVKTTPNLVEAAMVEFVGQTIVVPNTPALIYGYFCAKKYGFEGSVGEFLTQVIDDFYQARGINYYEEVTGWEMIGKATLETEEQPQPAAARA